MALYPERVLEHARHPKRFGRLADPDLQFEEVNPLCGDRIRIELRIMETDEILEARFSGEMCAIAKGAASILFESLERLTPAAVIRISDEQILDSLGGPIRPNRRQCALLPIIALRAAIRGRDHHERIP